MCERHIHYDNTLDRPPYIVQVFVPVYKASHSQSVSVRLQTRLWFPAIIAFSKDKIDVKTELLDCRRYQEEDMDARDGNLKHEYVDCFESSNGH